jgi:hypothetical protein
MSRIFEILEQPQRAGGVRRIVGSGPTYADAVELARELFRISHFDHDEDFPGCADFFTEAGTLYCIQPEGFTLNGSFAA